LLDSSFTHTFAPHAPAPTRQTILPDRRLKCVPGCNNFSLGGGKCHRDNCVVSSLYYNLVL
jgi:hypothetical protein